MWRVTWAMKSSEEYLRCLPLKYPEGGGWPGDGVLLLVPADPSQEKWGSHDVPRQGLAGPQGDEEEAREDVEKQPADVGEEVPVVTEEDALDLGNGPDEL
jgi:hypothetical protein